MQTKSLDVNGIATPYITFGQGQPVLFVHGALADYRMWLPHCQYLSASHQAFAFTQRYFGQPPRTDNPHQFGISIHYHDLVTFIKNLELGPVHLVAWSYGADVALTVAVNHPELLKSLFIYEPGFASYVENEQARKQIANDAEEMFQPIFTAVANGNLEAGVEKLLDGSGGKKGYFAAQPEAIRRQLLENAHTLPLQMSQVPAPDISPADLQSVSLPVCVAWGEKTRPLFSIVAEAAAENLPNCESLLVPNVGHMFPMEAPQQFVDHLLSFLERK